MALLIIPCPTASTFFSGYSSFNHVRNSLARAFNASKLSMSSGHKEGLFRFAKLGICFPVNEPQSRSRSKGVVVTAFSWGRAINSQVWILRCKSLETKVSIGSSFKRSASSSACLMPCSFSSPCVCPCMIWLALSTVSPCLTRYNKVITSSFIIAKIIKS